MDKLNKLEKFIIKTDDTKNFKGKNVEFFKEKFGETAEREGRIRDFLKTEVQSKADADMVRKVLRKMGY